MHSSLWAMYCYKYVRSEKVVVCFEESTKIVFGMPYLSMFNRLARSFRMRYSPTVHFWNLLYVLLAKASVGDSEAGFKGGVLMRTELPV